MPTVLDPFQFVLIAVAGWMNQRQLQMIEYLREENRVLREQLGERRLRLTDDQRRRLAARAKGLGRKVLAESATIVTPETLLRWHRRLIAQKYDGSGLAAPAGLARLPQSRPWWFTWRNKIGVGAIGAFRVPYPIWFWQSRLRLNAWKRANGSRILSSPSEDARCFPAMDICCNDHLVRPLLG